MIRLFEEIRDAFPHLSMVMDQDPANVDLSVDIPAQPGLMFQINLNLQGDELHLNAGAFWLEWFPCTRPDVVEAYSAAIHGLLNGTYRIREQHRGGRPFKAQLQRPDMGGWQTIGTWYGWGWPVARRTTERILQVSAARRASEDSPG
jgi:hypothetical protein